LTNGNKRGGMETIPTGIGPRYGAGRGRGRRGGGRRGRRRRRPRSGRTPGAPGQTPPSGGAGPRPASWPTGSLLRETKQSTRPWCRGKRFGDIKLGKAPHGRHRGPPPMAGWGVSTTASWRSWKWARMTAATPVHRSACSTARARAHRRSGVINGPRGAGARTGPVVTVHPRGDPDTKTNGT